MKLSEFIGLLEKYPEKYPCRFYDIKNKEFLYYVGYAAVYGNRDKVIIYLRHTSFVLYRTVIRFLNTIVVNKDIEVEFSYLQSSTKIPGDSIPSPYYKIANQQTGTP